MISSRDKRKATANQFQLIKIDEENYLIHYTTASKKVLTATTDDSELINNWKQGKMITKCIKQFINLCRIQK